MYEWEKESLDQAILTARQEAEKLIQGRPADQTEILTKIFNAVIEFRKADYLKLEEQKTYYLRIVDDMYVLLPETGLSEEEVVKMSRELREKMIATFKQ